jgi:hypothetical protein
MNASAITQGAEANRSGQYGENQFEALATSFGIPIVEDDAGYHGIQLFPQSGQLLIRQVKYELESGLTRFDYVYRDFGRGITLPIEIKSQLGSGSTDQKIIHSLEELHEAASPGAWLVLFGGGFRKKIQDAAHRKAQRMSAGNKRVRVINAVGNVLFRYFRRLVDDGEI